MRRIARYSLIGLGTLVALILVLLVAGLLGLRTESGRDWLTALLNAQLAAPEQRITVTGLTGDLPWSLRIARIEIADRDGVWLTLDQAALDLDPAALLHGTARIEVLSAAKLAMLRPPSAPTTPPAPSAAPSGNPLALPRLPVDVEVDKFAIERIELPPALIGEPVVLSVAGSAHLETGSAEAQLSLQRIDGQAGNVTLKLDYAGPERLGLELHAAEPSGKLLARFLPDAGVLPLKLDLGGQGPLAGWRGKLVLQAGSEAKVTADLALGRAGSDLTASLQGEAVPATLVPAPLRDAVGTARFDLAASLADAGPVGLDRFDLTFGAGSLHAVGRFDPKAASMSARLDLDTALAPFAVMAQTQLAGGLHVEAVVTGSLKAPGLALTLTGKDIQTANLGIAAFNAQLDAATLADKRVHLTGSGRFAGLTSTGAPTPPALGDTIDWKTDLTAARDGSRVEIAQAALSGGGLDLDASGRLERGALNGHLHVAARDLARFAPMAHTKLAGSLLLDAEASSPDGQAVDARLTGKLDDFRSGVAAADALLGRSVTVTATAKRSAPGRIDLRDLKLAGAGVTVTATGSLDPGGALKAHAAIDLPSLEPLEPALDTALKGRLVVTADGTGTLADPGATIVLTGTDLAAGANRLDRLEATVTAPALSKKVAKIVAKLTEGEAKATLSATVAQAKPNTIEVKDLVFEGPATVARGALALDLRSSLVSGALNADIADLAVWAPIVGPGLSGRLALDAKLTDQGGQGLNATLQGDRLALGAGTTLQHVQLTAQLADLLGTPRGTIALDGTKLGVSGAAVDTLQLQAEARNPGDFGFTLKSAGKAQDRPFTLSSTGQAVLDKAGQRLALATLDGKIADLTLKLDQPLEASRRGRALALTGLSLDLGGGTLTGHAGSDGKTVELDLHGKKLPLAKLARLGGQKSLAGTLAFDAALSGPLAGPQGHLSASLLDLRLEADTHPEIPALGLSVAADLRPDTVEVRGRIDGAKGSAALGFSGTVPIAFAPGGGVALRQDGALQATLEGWGKLEELGELIPMGEDNAGGRVTIAVTVGGTPAAPQAGGKITVTDGRYDNDATGLTLRNLQVELDGDQQAFVVHRFAATDGESGRLSAEGKVDLAAEGGPALDLSATLADFTGARGDDLTAVLDGKLQVSGKLVAPKVTADVTMKRADINIPDQLPASVPVLQVTRIDSRQKAPPPKPAGKRPPAVDAALDIHFHDPGQTFVRGRGLDSEWQGELTISGTAAQPWITGSFETVNGTFDTLGKSFVLQRGVLWFDGSTLPTLDMMAQIQATDVTAQILIQGSPDKPDIKLTSTPTLPQDEILSRVLFGSGVGQLTPAQGLQLAQAASTLAGGGPGVLDRLRNRAGLDRLSVGNSTNPNGTSSATTGSTISGGKYVAPGVFVGVDQGLTGTSTRAKVEVEITPHITANATAGAASNASSLGVQYKLDY